MVVDVENLKFWFKVCNLGESGRIHKIELVIIGIHTKSAQFYFTKPHKLCGKW